MPSPSRRASALRSTLATLFVAVGAACGSGTGPAGGATIPRDTFVAVFVDLRTAAVRADVRELPADEREAILAAHGVSEDDLLSFADIHGPDIVFMRGVWNDVEAELDATRTLVDSTAVR